MRVTIRWWGRTNRCWLSRCDQRVTGVVFRSSALVSDCPCGGQLAWVNRASPDNKAPGKCFPPWALRRSGSAVRDGRARCITSCLSFLLSFLLSFFLSFLFFSFLFFSFLCCLLICFGWLIYFESFDRSVRRCRVESARRNQSICVADWLMMMLLLLLLLPLPLKLFSIDERLVVWIQWARLAVINGGEMMRSSPHPPRDK